MNKLWYVIFALVGIIVLIILFQPKPNEPNTEPWKRAIEQREDKIKAKDAQIQALLNEREKKDSIHLAEKASLKTALNAKDARIEKLIKKPVVIQVRESTPEVDSLITDLQDKINFQSSYIHQVDSAYNDLRGDFEKLKTNFEGQISLYQSNYNDQLKINESERKSLRKVRRQLRVMKVVGVVGTVGGIFLGSSF